jgi:hypothetical protein
LNVIGREVADDIDGENRGEPAGGGHCFWDQCKALGRLGFLPQTAQDL